MTKLRHETYRFYSIDGFEERFVVISDFYLLIDDRNRLRKAIEDALEVFDDSKSEDNSVAVQMAACLRGCNMTTPKSEFERELRAELHLRTKVDRLEAENSKLRAALKQIALGDGYYGAQAKEYKEIARKALGVKSEKESEKAD